MGTPPREPQAGPSGSVPPPMEPTQAMAQAVAAMANATAQMVETVRDAATAAPTPRNVNAPEERASLKEYSKQKSVAETMERARDKQRAEVKVAQDERRRELFGRLRSYGGKVLKAMEVDFDEQKSIPEVGKRLYALKREFESALKGTTVSDINPERYGRRDPETFRQARKYIEDYRDYVKAVKQATMDEYEGSGEQTTLYLSPERYERMLYYLYFKHIEFEGWDRLEGQSEATWLSLLDVWNEVIKQTYADDVIEKEFEASASEALDNFSESVLRVPRAMSRKLRKVIADQ